MGVDQVISRDCDLKVSDIGLSQRPLTDVSVLALNRHQWFANPSAFHRPAGCCAILAAWPVPFCKGHGI